MKKINIKRAGLYSNILMLITTVHHAYGAITYDTPWRWHILLMSVPVILITIYLAHLLDNNGLNYKRLLPLWLYSLIILVPSIGVIGLFEGVYNHVIKVILFYAGASQDLLVQMFPPPKYEMPNDFWFEFTGIMQGIVVVPLISRFLKVASKVVKIRKQAMG